MYEVSTTPSGLALVSTALFLQPGNANQTILRLKTLGPQTATALNSQIAFKSRRLSQDDSTPLDQFTVISGPVDITADDRDGTYDAQSVLLR